MIIDDTLGDCSDLPGQLPTLCYCIPSYNGVSSPPSFGSSSLPPSLPLNVSNLPLNFINVYQLFRVVACFCCCCLICLVVLDSLMFTRWILRSKMMKTTAGPPSFFDTARVGPHPMECMENHMWTQPMAEHGGGSHFKILVLCWEQGWAVGSWDFVYFCFIVSKQHDVGVGHLPTLGHPGFFFWYAPRAICCTMLLRSLLSFINSLPTKFKIEAMLRWESPRKEKKITLMLAMPLEKRKKTLFYVDLSWFIKGWSLVP